MISTNKKWIAVGDAARFVIYEKKMGGSLSEVKSFHNASAHLKVSDLTTGQPGRSSDSFSRSRGGQRTTVARHAYTNEQDAKMHAEERFLREVSDYLDKAYLNHSFDSLVLVVNSRLLGKLRAFLSRNTRATVMKEHIKDLAWVCGPELEDRVESVISVN